MHKLKKSIIFLSIMTALGATPLVYSMCSTSENIPKYEEFLEKSFEVVEWNVTTGETLTGIANFTLQDTQEDKKEYIQAIRELSKMDNSCLVAGKEIKVLVPKDFYK